MERMLRPETEFEDLQRDGPAITPYWDPVLRRSRSKLLTLLRSLLRLGLVRALPRGAGACPAS
eukprot:2776784-Lingulodinium_polyedra.AAC.1